MSVVASCRSSKSIYYNLQPKRPSFRQIMLLDTGERFHRRRFGEPDPQVELVGQVGVKVMALPLRLRAVDDTDGALKTLALQVGNQRFVAISAQVQQEPRDLASGAQ